MRLARDNFGTGAAPQAVEAAVALNAEEEKKDGQRRQQDGASQAESVFHGKK